MILLLAKFTEQFNASVMHEVVRRGDVTLARALNRHGLSFSLSNGLGTNAVYTAVSAQQFEMLKYLINEKNISVKPYSYGFDPLDEALLNLTKGAMNLRYVSLLLTAGAEIEQSHKEIVFELAANNLDLYLQLISDFPMFKS